MTRVPSLGPRGEGWVALQFGMLAVAVVVGAVADPWPSARGPLTIAGTALALLGAWLAWRGFRDLGRSLTAFPRPSDQAELVTTGIYARVRHPLYGALILITLGWALARGPVVLAPTLALAVILDLKSRREESFLLERYPGYRAYRDRVGRRFIPGGRTPRS